METVSQELKPGPELAAGREMDAEIQRRVFGSEVRENWPCWQSRSTGDWHANLSTSEWEDSRHPVYERTPNCEDALTRRENGMFLDVVPFYSTDPAAAWQVVEAMKQAGWSYEAGGGPGQQEGFRFTRAGHLWGKWEWCETLPEAICRAALRALEVWG